MSRTTGLRSANLRSTAVAVFVAALLTACDSGDDTPDGGDPVVPVVVDSAPEESLPTTTPTPKPTATRTQQNPVPTRTTPPRMPTQTPPVYGSPTWKVPTVPAYGDPTWSVPTVPAYGDPNGG